MCIELSIGDLEMIHISGADSQHKRNVGTAYHSEGIQRQAWSACNLVNIISDDS